MRKSQASGVSHVAGLLLIALASTATLTAAPADKRLAVNAYGKLPLSFEENRGQTDARVRYISRGAGYTLFLTGQDATLALTALDGKRSPLTTAIRMSFAGAQSPEVSAAEPLTSRSSYFRGSDPSGWLTHVPHYAKVRYRGLYAGVDAVFYGNQRQLEYDFLVSPGADPKQIRLRFDGVKAMSLSPEGDLVLRSALGDVRQLRPVVYQVVNGRRRDIGSSYVIDGNEARFSLARYDRTLPLIIDPVIAWSTYIGGTGTDTVTGIAVNAQRETLVTGHTASADFPAVQRFQGTALGGASDVFVMKIGANGGSVAWSTFIGGTGIDQAFGIAVDNQGSVYVCGLTDSPNFPRAPLIGSERGIQPALGGAQDAFVLKLLNDASGLVYSTYFGGFGNDVANDIKVDKDRQAVIAGTTSSTNLSSFGGPYGFFSGGGSDAFVTKFQEDGRGLIWSSYLGGNQVDYGNGVAVDKDANVYVTGATLSLGFPRTNGAYQSNLRSVQFTDAFVTKINANGALGYSTFLGGGAYDEGVSIAVDDTGHAYVFGNTDSGNFPTQVPLQAANSGNRDAFITKLNPAGSVVLYSSYLGGSGSENAGKVAVFENRAHLVGSTNSTNFPVRAAMYGTSQGLSDVFIVEIEADASAFRSSTYFGGTGDDNGLALGLDAAGNIYFGGNTFSTNLPVLNQVQTLMAGASDGFIVKVANCTLTVTPVNSGSPGQVIAAAAGTYNITITGSTECTWTAVSNAAWLGLTGTTTGAGNGTVTFTVAQNVGAPRTGTVSIGGISFTVTQLGGTVTGGGCVYPLAVDSVIVSSAGQTGPVTISTNGTCPWTATSSANWLQFWPYQGDNTTTSNYVVYPNFSTQTRSATVTVSNGTNPRVITFVQAGSVLNFQQRFVTLLYSNFLGRYPAQNEIDFHANRLAQGLSPVDLATEFFRTAEFNLNGRLVASAYYTLLGRLPEFTTGWQFQRNAIVTGTITQPQFVANIINSEEFRLKWGSNLTNEQFVILLYNQALGRTPSQAEIDFQVGELVAGRISRAGMAAAFLSVPEYLNRVTTRLDAYLLHAALLRREPSPQELTNREIQLATTPLRDIINQFIGAPEFNLQL